jgi:hypothetical protein
MVLRAPTVAVAVGASADVPLVVAWLVEERAVRQGRAERVRAEIRRAQR